MGWDAPWHWIILIAVVIALFGYKRLPDAARSLGRSLRVFKTEIKGMTDDDAKRADAGTSSAAAEPTGQPSSPPLAQAVPTQAVPSQPASVQPATQPASAAPVAAQSTENVTRAPADTQAPNGATPTD